MWEKITAFSNLLNAYQKAAKGKRSKQEVASFEFNLEAHLFLLKEDLEKGKYRPGPYNHFTIHYPKKG